MLEIAPLAVIEEIIEETPIVEEKPFKSVFCSCVKAVRYFGIDVPKQDAKYFKPNATMLTGEIVLQRFWDRYEGKWNYHLAKYWILPSGNLYLDQGNKIKCQRTQETIPPDHPSIVGFWKE